jgi:aspartyl aminopeptidase
MQETLSTLDSLPTSSFFASYARERFLSAGFIELFLSNAWPSPIPDQFFVVHGGSIIAISKTDTTSGSFFITHTDSPSLKVDPATVVREGCLQAPVTTGDQRGLWWSWLDRDLTLAGIALLSDQSTKPIFVKETCAAIPSLSVHQATGSGVHTELSMPNNFFPIFALAGTTTLKAIVANAAGCDESEVIEYDVNLIPAEPSAVVGLEGEFIASYRARLLGAISGLDEFLAAGKPQKGLICFAALDNGTRMPPIVSNFLLNVIKRLSVDPGFAQRSFIVAHENFPASSGSKATVDLGSGCYYDSAIRSRYSVDGNALAKFLDREEKGGVKIQRFTLEASLPNPGFARGWAIGTRLGITGVDVGIPVAGLNSSREVVAVKDVTAFAQLVRVHFGAEVSDEATSAAVKE